MTRLADGTAPSCFPSGATCFAIVAFCAAMFIHIPIAFAPLVRDALTVILAGTLEVS